MYEVNIAYVYIYTAHICMQITTATAYSGFFGTQ